MSETAQPLHHLVCDDLERCTLAPYPPPTREEMCRELGWALIVAERQTRAERDERN